MRSSGLYLETFKPVRKALREHLAIGRDRRGGLILPVRGGAFTASGLYVTNWIDVLDATQLAFDLSLTSHKWALYTNSDTPNFSSDTTYSSTNESSGTGYSAGGITIASGGGSPTVTESPTGTIKYDQNDIVWAGPITVTAHGAKLYADALADQLICALTFGIDVSSFGGTFTITFAAGGVFTWDVTP